MSTINPLSSRGPSSPLLEKPLEKPSKKLLFIPIFGWIAYAFLNARYNSSLKNRTVTVETAATLSQNSSISQTDARNRQRDIEAYQEPLTSENGAVFTALDENDLAQLKEINDAMAYFRHLKMLRRANDISSY